MPDLMRPLHLEHLELMREIDTVRATTDSLGEARPQDSRLDVDRVLAILRGSLLPHAHAEEVALYPVVASLLGSQMATATMSRDHEEIGHLIQRVGDLAASSSDGSSGDLRELRATLYALLGIVHVHFAKEEEIYFPLLNERLTPQSADEMFEKLEAAAREAKAAQ